MERCCDDRIGALEEVVDDLNLVCTRPEAGERVDEPLEVVVVVDDLLGRPLLERVRLVVDDERAPAVELEHVEATVEQDAVVLEGKRPLRPRAGQRRDAPRELGLAVGANEAADPLELLVGNSAVPAADEPLELDRR
jgi:hypothetical protein